MRKTKRLPWMPQLRASSRSRQRKTRWAKKKSKTSLSSRRCSAGSGKWNKSVKRSSTIGTPMFKQRKRLKMTNSTTWSLIRLRQELALPHLLLTLRTARTAWPARNLSNSCSVSNQNRTSRLWRGQNRAANHCRRSSFAQKLQCSIRRGWWFQTQASCLAWWMKKLVPKLQWLRLALPLLRQARPPD